MRNFGDTGPVSTRAPRKTAAARAKAATLPLPTTPHPDLVNLPKRHGMSAEHQAMASTLLWAMQARIESAGVEAARKHNWCSGFKDVMAKMFPGGPRHGSAWRDAEGYDCDGNGPDGYDRNGYNSQGFNREGRTRWGYDWQGYDESGFNDMGFNRDGVNRDGKRWDAV